MLSSKLSGTCVGGDAEDIIRFLGNQPQKSRDCQAALGVLCSPRSQPQASPVSLDVHVLVCVAAVQAILAALCGFCILGVCLASLQVTPHWTQGEVRGSLCHSIACISLKS